MIIATYQQWVDGTNYVSGYYKKYTSIYKDKYELKIDIMRWKEKENPMIISGIWEL